MADKFKVGDRVTANGRYGPAWDACTVVEPVKTWPNNWRVDSDSDGIGVIDGEDLELMDTELEELRAFRDMALERYPDLKPVDDVVMRARQLIGEVYGNASGRGTGPERVRLILDGRGDDYWEMRCVIEALKRGA